VAGDIEVELVLETLKNTTANGSPARGAIVSRRLRCALGAGAVLLYAVALRLWHFIHASLAPSDIQGLPDFAVPLIGGEVFLGLWLISGALPSAARRVAIGCFSAFACYTLFEALSGKTDCGCFGQVKVESWFTAMLGVALVLALVFLGRPAAKVFRKQQNLHFVSQNHPRRTYILRKPVFAERSSGIGPETVTYGQGAS
jgi:hypothetical protein